MEPTITQEMMDISITYFRDMCMYLTDEEAREIFFKLVDLDQNNYTEEDVLNIINEVMNVE